MTRSFLPDTGSEGLLYLGGTRRAVGQLPQRGALVPHTLAQSKLRVLYGVSVLCLCWQRQQAVSLDSLLKNRGCAQTLSISTQGSDSNPGAHRNTAGVCFSLCCGSGKLPLTPSVPRDSFAVVGSFPTQSPCPSSWDLLEVGAGPCTLTAFPSGMFSGAA